MTAVGRQLSRVRRLATSLPHLVRGERTYRVLRRQIDTPAFTAVTRRYAADVAFQDGRKFLRIGYHLRESVGRTLLLELDRRPRQRILDLGSGAGYFLVAARHLGHDVQGLDLPNNGFYSDLACTFDLPRWEWRIEPFVPLPEPARTFDLVTAFSITFDRRPGGRESGWSPAEWDHLLQDLRRRLSVGGRIFLRLNISGFAGLSSRPELVRAFREAPGFEAMLTEPRDILLTKVD